MTDLPTNLGFPSPKPLDPTAAGEAVDALFSAWGTIGDPYKPYILFNAMDPDTLSRVAGPAEGAQGAPVNFSPFPGSPNTLRFQYITALLQNADSNPIFFPNPSKAVFVLTEVFTVPLSYGAAQIISNAMMAGLTTRLIFEKYNEKWSQFGLPGINLNLGIKSFGLQTAITKLSTDLTTPKSWKQSGLTTFEQIQSLLMDSASTQAAGIILGWIAADSILALPAAKRDEAIKGIWKVVGLRYTNRDLGALVSFTLNYLIGFIRNKRTIDIINNQKPAEERRIEVILQYLTDHVLNEPRNNNLVQTAINFHKMLLDEFYAIAQKDVTGGFSLADKKAALQEYRAFLDGFQRGSMVAAELLFRETFSSAYDIGYARGFRDGYAQGYAAGWQAGYDTGFSEGKAVGMGLSSALTQISESLTKVDNFVNDLGKAGTVIVEIAALF
jgi:hypothetical protein